MVNKRGQAALEFLTTYGWAFLVILVMIGALAYFGVLDPSRFLPDRCTLEQGFGCGRFILRASTTPDDINFEFTNNLGKTIFVSGFQYQVPGSTVTTYAACSGASTVPAGTIAPGQTINVVCHTVDGVFTAGAKGKVLLQWTYNEGSSADPTYAKTASGDIYSKAN